MNITYCLPQKQQGAVFVTGLIFLVVITMLGITAVKTASLEERMAGNMLDRNLALQAAEMGLRYAEQHIMATNIINQIDGVIGFDALCTNGLCYFNVDNAAPTNPAWQDYCSPNCPISYTAGTTFVSGSTYTAPALPAGLANPPTYLIEGIQRQVPGSGTPLFFYRITARAQGAKAGTVVWLQEVFRP